MTRNRIPSVRRFRTLALVAAAAASVACADRVDPTSPASLGLDARAGNDSAACDLTVSGTVSRFSGAGDSTSDTLGRRVPLPGARVALYFVAPLPRDSVPRDSVPRDSIPRDSVPRDSVPRDSVPRDSVGGDSLGLRAPALRAARAPGDTAGGRDSSRGPVARPGEARPVAIATARGDGTYTLRGVCPGIYRIEATEPGTGRSAFTYVIVRGNVSNQNFTFPPAR